MTSIDQRAREAGAQLRGWDPDLPQAVPHELIGGTARRRRRTRLALAAAAAGLVVIAAVGATLAGTEGREAETGPVSGDTQPQRPAPTAVPPTTVPDTTAPPARAVPETTADPVAATELPTCRGTLPDGTTYVVTYPQGWHTNETAFEVVDPCTHFGHEPIAFERGTEYGGVPSNAAVLLDLQMGPDPFSWEYRLATSEGSDFSPGNPAGIERLSVERVTTARGDTALREEFRSPEGHWVRWMFLLDGVATYALGYERGGVTFDEAAAAAEMLVQSIRIER